MTTTLPLEGIKAKQQKTWSSGDYGAVAALIHPVAEDLVRSADVAAGSRVLDVATGTGNAAIAAARTLSEVVAVDYVPELMERGRQRAEAERLPVRFVEADAENLPCDDGEYDVVLSVFGVMFAPDQEKAAAELLRVVRPGGTVALANWTPDGFIGGVLRTVGRHVPPPPGLRPPTLWGTEERLRELFGGGVADLRVTQRSFVWRFTSVEAFADLFRDAYGPTLKAFEAVGEPGAKALYDDLVELARRYDVGQDGTVRIPSAYAEVVAYRA